MQQSGYDFRGLDIHGALVVNEQVRKGIDEIKGDSKIDDAARGSLIQFSDALTEHVYQETLKMERAAEKKD